MKTIKKLFAVVLAILVVFVTFPTFTLPTKAASDNYYSKYGVTYNQLFSLYPQYLSCDSESLIVDDLIAKYRLVLAEYSNTNGDVASYLATTNNGISVFSDEFLASLGITDEQKQTLKNTFSEALAKNIIKLDKTSTSVASEISDNFTVMKSGYDVSTAQGKSDFVADIKNACVNLSDSDVELIIEKLFDNYDFLLETAPTTVEFWLLATAIIEMQEMQLENLNRLIENSPIDSAFAQAVTVLVDEIYNDVAKYVYDNYCTADVVKTLVSEINTTVNNTSGTLAVPAALAINLGKSAAKTVISALYNAADTTDIIQTVYLATVANELQLAVAEQKSYFVTANTIETADITDYEFLYSSYITAIRTTLESALAKTVSTEQKNQIQSAIAICNSYNYDRYIDLCMQDLKADIDAGIVKKPSQIDASGKLNDVTPEESHASIAEKFRQVKEAYPPNVGVTFTQSYGGSTQALGFIRFVFNKIFDCDMPAWYKNTKRYEFGNSQNLELVGQLEGSAQVTAANVKDLLWQAKVGYVIQASGKTQHTMMVVSANENNITVYECNRAGECGIYERTISYADFAAAYNTPSDVSECGITLYKAINYDSLYWDGSSLFYEDMGFVIDANGVLTQYKGSQRHVTIPDVVTEIGNNAFKNNDKIVRVTMPNTVTSIGESAFYDCDNLITVDMSPYLETIGYQAFYSCDSFSNLILPDKLINIGTHAFRYCVSLYSVVLPSSLTNINNYVFADCTALSNVVIPNSITSIGEYSFYACKSLREIVIPDSVTSISASAFYECINLKNVTLSKSLTNIGGRAFYNTAIESIEIPKSLEDCGTESCASYKLNDITYSSIYGGPFAFCHNLKNVSFETGTTRIADDLFNGCTGLESIVIPDTVTVIESNAFDDCFNLKEVFIGNAVTTINDYAFYRCVSLPEIIIPDSVTSIGYVSFAECYSLKDVTLSKSLTTLSGLAFLNTAIESIEIPKSLEDCGTGTYSTSYKFNDVTYSSIYGGPFAFCHNLKNVSFETGTSCIADDLFNGCMGLESIVIPDTVTVIESNAFDDCFNLKEVFIGNAVTTINAVAFYRCVSLEGITLPDSLTTIGGSVFAGCSLLKSIEIPDNVTSISASAFEECINLKNVTLSKSLTNIGGRAFYNTAIESIEIPKSLEDCGTGTYSTSYKFNDVTYSSIYDGPFGFCHNLKNVSFETGTTRIADNLFNGCTGLESIVIPDTVTVIEGNAFDDCFNLKEVIVGNAVTTINGYAFYRCVSLEGITLPDSLTTIGGSVFAGCSSLKNIEIPDSVTAMGTYCFDGCTSLESVKLPNSCKNIMQYMFRNCVSLKIIDFPKTVTTIQEYAFYGCTALKEAVLPESTKTIGNYSFKNCTALEKVYIPQSTKTIGNQAFMTCESLVDLTFADYSITEIKSETFKDCSALARVVLPKGLTTIGSDAFKNDYSLLEVVIPESVTSISATAFSYPKKTTIFGKKGSYAETFANKYGFLFVDNTVPASGIALESGEKYIIVDRGSTYRAIFESDPVDSTDVVTLTASNSNVTFNGHDIYASRTGDTVITATATSGVTYQFTLHIRDVKNIAITNMPSKLNYVLGDELDLDGMIVQVNYADNSYKEVNDYTVTGFDSSVEGKCTVTVSWVSAYGNTYKTTFTVDVVDPRPKLTGIIVDTMPNKTEYDCREMLDLTGLVIKATYTDGSAVEIDDYTITGYNSLNADVQTLTVTYGEFTASFNVIVGIWITEIAVETLPDKTDYYIGDNIDTTGFKIKATYSNGYTEIIDSGYTTTVNTESVGSRVVAVNYDGFTTSFNVNVSKPTVSLSANNKTITVGNSETLTVATTPVGMEVVWTSSNNDVATVDNGVITAVSVGSATITATLKYNGYEYKATCKVITEPQEAVYTSLKVENLPSKTVYSLGETLNFDGLTLRQIYSDGSYNIIDEGYTTLDVDTMTPGIKTVTVIYRGISTRFDIVVNAPAFNENSPKFVVNNASVRTGDIFTVTVSTVNNPGIVSMKLLIDYDADVLEFVSFGEGDFADVAFGPNTGDPLVVNWVDTINPNNETNGVVATLIFKVKSSAPQGDSEITINYDYEDVYNSDFENVIFATQNGIVTVERAFKGDVSNDGKINNKDLGLIMQYLNGWDVAIDVASADVNADGKVNNKDYGLLMQYLNGWDVELK